MCVDIDVVLYVFMCPLSVSADDERFPQCRSGDFFRCDPEHGRVPFHHVQTFPHDWSDRTFLLKPELHYKKQASFQDDKTSSSFLICMNLSITQREKCAAFLSSLQFIFAGFVSNLLFKYPGLLPVSATQWKP